MQTPRRILGKEGEATPTMVVGVVRMAQERGSSRRARGRLSRAVGGVGRPQLVVCALVVVALAVLGVVRSLSSGGFEVSRSGDVDGNFSQDADLASGNANEGARATEATDEAAAASEATTVVHVDGAVACPGVYDLAGDEPRVRDAVAAAGGLTAEADTSGLNLAARIADGSKVHVPARGEAAATVAEAQPSASEGGPASAAGSSDGLVNINTATAEELDSLPGVGPSTAQAIIEERERNGPFSSTEDLMRVSGIGEKKYAKLEGSICV